MRITSIQMELGDGKKQERIAKTMSLLDDVPDSDLIILPEIWPTGFFCFDHYKTDSELIDGDLVNHLREKAIQKNCYLHTGSFVEREGTNYFNTSLLLDPSGKIIGKYRKIHLFGYHSLEQQILSPGKMISIIKTPFAIVGMATCYDLRFPELFRRMVDQDVNLFLITSAWPEARLKAWQLFNKARAHENLAFLVSSNCSGANNGNRYAGHSMFIDPLGDILKQAGKKEAIITHDINIEDVNSIRQDFPALEDRVFH